MEPHARHRRSRPLIPLALLGASLTLAASATRSRRLRRRRRGRSPGPGRGSAQPGPDPLAVALAPQRGGLTPDEVGRVASRTRASVRTKQAELRAAAARVDQALVNFFPRVSASATYTRLSEVPGFSFGSGGIVGAQNTGVIFTGACPPGVTPPPGATGCAVDSKGTPIGAQSVSFPVPLNSYSLVASLAVPISDYVLRISQGYSAASHGEKGKKLEVEAEMLSAAADGKIAYFNWIRAKGQAVVATLSVEQTRAHVDDARKGFGVGLIPRVDVLRLEAQLAAAQQLEAEARAFEAIASEQLRTVLGLTSDKPLAIGSDVLHEQASPPSETLEALTQRAMSDRLEIRALDETIYSLKETEAIARAGYFPRIDAFADATYANPNQRVFPQREEFRFTWDAGVRLSWTLNDTFTAIGATAEAKARTAQVMEQKGALRDGLRIEVASAYSDMVKAAPAIEAADRGLVAAEEALRVRTELFRNGKATSVDLIDAQTEVTRARLNRLNAHIGVLVARARFDHATGRDVPAALRPTGQ